jgi:hypothetical protein
MIDETAYSKQLTYYWWKATGKTSAVCDRCHAVIPQGEGYVVEPALLGVNFGSGMQDLSGTPDMLCETCYQVAKFSGKKETTFRGHIPGLCDCCGRAYKEGVVVQYVGGKGEYGFAPGSSQIKSVTITNIKPQDVYICERCVQSKKYSTDSRPDNFLTDTTFSAYAKIVFGVLFTLVAVGLLIFGQTPGEFNIWSLLCPAAALILLGNGIWSVYTMITKRKLSSGYFDLPTSALLKREEAPYFFKDEIGTILLHRGVTQVWTLKGYNQEPRAAVEAVSGINTSQQETPKEVTVMRHWVAKGAWAEGRAYAEKSGMAYWGWNWEALDMYGQALAGTGEKERAADAFRWALLLKPGEEGVLAHLKTVEA